MRVAFKIFAGAWTQWESRCEHAAEFASGLEPGRLINITCSDIGIIVWYWVDAPADQGQTEAPKSSRS
jgi:hypothetical protein